VNSYLLLYPDNFSRWFLELMDLPIEYRFKLLFFSVIHLITAWIFERFVIVGKGRSILEGLRKKKPKQYESVHTEFKKLQKEGDIL
jgi:ABC-type enterochelin transport system permease subunit